MFIRRLFYNPDTGEVLVSYMMQGSIRPVTVEEDAAQLGLVDYACMEWTEPDEQVEADFAKSYGRVSVDVSQAPPVLVFDFSEIVVEDETEDMRTALELLGYTEE